MQPRNLDGLAARLTEDLVKSEVSRELPLGPFTTYRVGGAARLFVEIGDTSDLDLLLSANAEFGVPVLVLGLGSNLLVADAGFDGLAVRLGDGFDHIDILGASVDVGGAAALPVVARRTAAAGLTGFEWAVGVPGSIGGAVRMNAGGHGSDMSRSLVEVRTVNFLTGHHQTRRVTELDLGYRRSNLSASDCVVSARLELEAGDKLEAELAIGEIVRWRRENQPGGQNAGSVFTNPPDDSAGRLIDAAGCKGLRVGTAEVSTKHANFIQVDPSGSADDVFALMRLVASRVESAVGLALDVETRLVGFEPFRLSSHTSEEEE